MRTDEPEGKPGAGGADEIKLKTITTAEIKVWDKDGNVIEHIRVNQDGQEERVE